jgi:dihydrofolate reductase
VARVVGLQGPESLGSLAEQPERGYTILMGATTYRMFSEFAAQMESPGSAAGSEEAASIAELANATKVVFSSTLQQPLPLAHTTLVRGDAVTSVAAMKREGTSPMRTVGSLALCRSLLEAGLVDRFRVVVGAGPVITGRAGRERILNGYPDVALKLVASQTFDGRTQLLEYVPTVLPGPPGTQHGG